MSDLISRQSLIDAVNEYIELVYDGVRVDDASIVDYQQLHDDDKVSYILEGFIEFFAILQEQPTVYNINKVSDELEEYLFNKYCIEGDDKVDEIIRKGGL